MNLYHYTTPENALLAAMGGGLTPGLGKGGRYAHMTRGLPVVWLTKQQHNEATAGDVVHMSAIGLTRPDGTPFAAGDPLFGGPVCCVVELERNHHLVRYIDFVKAQGLEFMPEYVPPSFKEFTYQWWIYMREVPASRIWAPLTRAQAIEACEKRIGKHADDLDLLEPFKRTRDQFAAEPEETLFVVCDGSVRIL